MSTHPRLALSGTAIIALLVGLLLGAGTVVALSPSRSLGSPAAAPSILLGALASFAPSTTDTTSTSGTTGSGAIIGSGGTAAAGAAIAYPYFGAAPGLAPDHTILVTGVGQTDAKSDGSNRAAAQKKALEAALADAKSQADAIASATGLSITGVLSVSASVSPYGAVMPMLAVPGAAPNAPVPAPTESVASPAVLSVSVTVAYTVR